MTLHQMIIDDRERIRPEATVNALEQSEAVTAAEVINQRLVVDFRFAFRARRDELRVVLLHVVREVLEDVEGSFAGW